MCDSGSAEGVREGRRSFWSIDDRVGLGQALRTTHQLIFGLSIVKLNLPPSHQIFEMAYFHHDSEDELLVD